MHGTIDIERLINNSDSEYPALYQLFGGYFHEDWREDHASPDDVLASFVREAPPAAVSEARAELQRLLEADLDDGALQRMLSDGFGSNYVPGLEGATSRGWLEHVGRRLQQER